MAYLDDLKTRRAAIATELAALDETKAGGKPDTTGGNAAAVAHVAYKDGLYRELKEIDALIKAAAEDAQAVDLAANGPWEIWG